jgi:short-subunit dehydrogenase
MIPERAALEPFSALIITGGSSGIGQSFIELCQKLKPELAICNLSRRRPDMIGSKLKLRHLTCDLALPGQIEAALPELEAFLHEEGGTGRILLVNNSGFGLYGLFPEPALDQQLEMVDVNVRAVVHLTGRLLPALRKRGGAVVTIASTAAFQPTPYLAVYGATKAFVLHWSLALNEELRGSGVRTLAVCPGPTGTRFFERAGLQQGSVPGVLSQTGEEVVRESLRALGRGRSQVVSGWKNWLGAAFSSRVPKPLAARVGAMFLKRWRLDARAP